METTKRNLKLIGEDNGFCRVYYRCKGTRELYCWQYDGRFVGFVFYVCSRDGEPSHEVAAPKETPLTKGEEKIGKQLNEFLKEQNKHKKH